MSVASIEGVTKRYAERVVLDGVTFGVADGERVGVIGLNGSGKSTLLRLVAGAEEPDSGRIVRADGARVRYLSQEPLLEVARTPVDAVLARPATFDPLTDRAEVQREQRARATLDRLGVRDVDAPVGRRSGGERKRIALAAVLAESCELLVLDEPTNHLDVEVIGWLEQQLRRWPRALLLVTHDRYLLDAVVTRVVEVTAGGLQAHAGGYADYLEARAQRVEQAAVEERKRANRARRELAWLRRGPKARTSKSRYRLQQARAAVEAAPGTERQSELEIDLPSRRLGGKVVNLHNAGKRMGGRWVLRGIDVKLAPDARIGVVGPNGSGKTTFLRLIAGDLEPDEGSVRRGDTVHPGLYGQEPPPPAGTRVLAAVEEIVRETPLTSGHRVSASRLLERFLFAPAQQKAYVDELSGGERRRLELLRVLATAPNLLLLDEPTNDLDLDTLAILEEYLDAWPGALVVATHDRYFLDRVCDQVWSIEPDGNLQDHPRGWRGYREQVAVRGRARDVRRERSQRGSPAPDRARRPRKRSYHEEREREHVERRIGELEQAKAALEAALLGTADDYEQAARLGAELADVLDALDRAESRWLELEMIGEDTG